VPELARADLDVAIVEPKEVESEAVSLPPRPAHQKAKKDGQKKASPGQGGSTKSMPLTQPLSEPQPPAQAQADERQLSQPQAKKKSAPLRPQTSQPIVVPSAAPASPQVTPIAATPAPQKPSAHRLMSPVELNEWNTQLVMGALQGLGGDPDENGWKRLLLNEVSAALKKSGLGFERSKLHALVKANPDQFRIVKSYFFYFR